MAINVVFNFACTRYDDVIKYNPVVKMSKLKAWYEKGRRKTIIKNADLMQWYGAVNELQNPLTKTYLLFTLLTGLRKNEAASIKWNDFDFEENTFTVRDTKNSESLTLPLSHHLHDVIMWYSQYKGASEYVFPGNGKSGYVASVQPTIQAITKATGVKFTLHDLRRTFVTVAESLDIFSFTVKKLVNHKQNADVTAGYVVPNIGRLRQAMDKISNELMKHMMAKEPAKVIMLNR
jgi:integrase